MTTEKKKQHVKGYSFKSDKVSSYTRKKTVKSYVRTVTVKPKQAKTKTASKKATPRRAKRGTKQTTLGLS